MSSNKTTNYQLHSWEPGDNFLRTEFNENFSALDTAIKGVETGASSALASARSALTSQVNAKAEVAVGSYTGDGQASQTISLGFTPRAVLVAGGWGAMDDNYRAYGGLAVTEQSVMTLYGNNPIVKIVNNGFAVYFNGTTNSSYLVPHTNMNAYRYTYIALR